VSDQNSQLTESQIEATRKEFHAYIASLPAYGPEPHWISFGKDGQYYYDGVRVMWRGWLAHAESIQARLDKLEKVEDAAKEWAASAKEISESETVSSTESAFVRHTASYRGLMEAVDAFDARASRTEEIGKE